MSALAFLTPAGPGDALARSSMEPEASRSGARWETLGGWNVAADYGDPVQERRRLHETAGLIHRSAMRKLELASQPVAAPLGQACHDDGGWVSLELFPQLEHARLLRSWAGLCDLSPDYSPILGATAVENFLISAGWGTYGFKAAPIVSRTLAELAATGRTPELIAPFALERFYREELVSELAAAAANHL